MRDPLRQVTFLTSPAIIAVLFTVFLSLSLPSVPVETADSVAVPDPPSALRPQAFPSVDSTVFHIFSADDYAGVFHGDDAAETVRSDHYSLVATVLGVNENDLPEAYAVLRERGSDGFQHHIVRPGSRIGDVFRVRRIFNDAVVLEGPLGPVRLQLDFSGAGQGREATPNPAVDVQKPVGDALTARFGGTATGTNQWTFERGALMDYYAELRNHPRRLLQIFDAMKPRYQEDQSILGYRLEPEGERDFFMAVGLRPGDVIYAVNHVPMTSRHRAEHFIRRVVADGLDAIVLEIERDGERRRHQYIIATSDD